MLTFDRSIDSQIFGNEPWIAVRRQSCQPVSCNVFYCPPIDPSVKPNNNDIDNNNESQPIKLGPVNVNPESQRRYWKACSQPNHLKTGMKLLKARMNCWEFRSALFPVCLEDRTNTLNLGQNLGTSPDL
ncbi:MAG: hypothetical protein L6R36_007874 [Xanthoria steineri]|nr:MAG: hypothetical protein L6R36_007874 [Xanthoria steineri]